MTKDLAGVPLISTLYDEILLAILFCTLVQSLCQVITLPPPLPPHAHQQQQQKK